MNKNAIIAEAKAAVARRKVSAEKKTQAEKVMRDYAASGFLLPGKNVFSGKTLVLVNDGAIWDYEAEDVFAATVSAQTIEAISKSDEIVQTAMIRHTETWQDLDSGQDFFVSKRKNFNGLNIPCQQVVYTDSKGIIIPLKDVYARLGLGLTTENADACTAGATEYVLTSVGTYASPDEALFEKESVSKSHVYAYDAPASPAQRKFHYLTADTDKKPVDAQKIIEAQTVVDAHKLKEKWAIVARLARGRKSVKKTEIPLPTGIGYAAPPTSPVKVMTQADRIAAAKRRAIRPAKALVCPVKLAAKKDCERTIEKAHKELRSVKDEIKTLVPGRLMTVPFRAKEERIIKTDDKIAALKDRAIHLRLVISDEKDEIENLSKGAI